MKIKELLRTLIEKKKEESVDIVLFHLDCFYNLLYSFYNLGLLYIATLLQSKGFKVKCIGSAPLFFLTQPQLRGSMQRYSPRLVGFYTNSDNIYAIRNLSSEVKSWIPGVRVLVGGPLATIEKEKMLDFPHFDIVVVGEGEYPVLRLAEYYLRGEGSLRDIPGIIYRHDGLIVKNPRAEPIANLDELPSPDYDLVSVKYGFFFSTGRGCPHKCTFCFQEVHGQGYRFHSAERVVSDIIRNVEKYDAKTVNIVDDTFIAIPKRVREICEKLIEYRKKDGKDFIFFCEGRVDTFDRHPDLLELLKEAGMARLQVGVESGDQRVLDAYKKGITLEQVERVINLCRKVGGISVYGNFILGGPFESEETFQNTLNFAKHLLNLAPGQFECASSLLCPYPGTEIARHPQAYGLKIIDTTWEKGLTLSDVSVSSESLNRDQIRQLQRRFDQEIGTEMRKIARRMDPSIMEKHFRWALDYKIHTLWYMKVLSKAPILESYFVVKKSRKFKSLKEIPGTEIPSWFPYRLLEKKEYSADGKTVELPGYFKKVRISRKEEVLIYEYSAGKLTVGEIALRVKEDLNLKMNEEAIIKRLMLPLYRRLERSYHIVFYR